MLTNFLLQFPQRQLFGIPGQEMDDQPGNQISKTTDGEDEASVEVVADLLAIENETYHQGKQYTPYY